MKFELSLAYLLVGWTDTGGAEPPAIDVKVSFITKNIDRKDYCRYLAWLGPNLVNSKLLTRKWLNILVQFIFAQVNPEKT